MSKLGKFAAACAAVLCAFGAFGEVTALSYIQEGLVGHWDGIDNVIVDGVRGHDATTKIWHDLSSRHNDGDIDPNVTWNGDCGIACANQVGSQTIKPVTLPSDAILPMVDHDFTVELLFEPTATARSTLFGAYGSGNITLEYNSQKLRISHGNSLDKPGIVAIACNAKTSITYTKRGDEHVVYKNGERVWGLIQALAAGDGPLKGGALAIGSESYRGGRNYGFIGNFYSVRIYDRALEATQVKANYVVDNARYLKNDLTGTLTVNGWPTAVGEVSPDYGAVAEMPETCSAPASWTSADGSESATCIGYEMTVDGVSVKSGEENSFAYEAPASGAAVVTWKWKMSATVAVMVDETLGGGTAAASKAVYAEGENVVLTATPADGYEFGWWTGDVPEAQRYAAEATFGYVYGMKNFTAHFRKIVHVSVDGSDDNGGTGPDDAFATIAKALAAAPCPSVKAGPGTFAIAAHLEVPNNARVSGTVVDDVCKTVVALTAAVGNVFVLNSPYATLDRLAITSGGKIATNSGNGRGVLMLGGGLVENCVITNCNTTDKGPLTSYKQSGGGIWMSGGGTVRKCLVQDCRVCTSSGGFYGGGVYVEKDGLVEDCIIRGCILPGKQNGAGVSLRGGTLRNTLIENCHHDYSTGNAPGGVWVEDGSVENCTIVKCYHKQSGEAQALAMTNGKVLNTILWGNYNKAVSPVGVTRGRGIVRNCTCDVELTGGLDNRTDDPSFVDFAGGNYQTAYSPCIDAGLGLAWMPGAKDLAGEERVLGKAVDLGCYEYRPSGVQLALSADTDGKPDCQKVTLTAEVIGLDASECDFAWRVTGSGDYLLETNETGLASLDLTLVGGVYSVEVTASKGDDSATRKIDGLVTVLLTDTYVSQTGSGTVPYADFAHGAATIEEAMTMTADGGTVHVDDGCYHLADSLLLVRDVRVKGERGPERVTFYTVPKVSTSAMVFVNHADAVLEGVTVSGYDDAGNQLSGLKTPGVLIDSKGGTVTNCVVDGVAGDNVNGPGVTILAGLLVDSTVRRCWSSSRNNVQYGGGVQISGGTVRDCRIVGNDNKINANSCGGGVYMTGGLLCDSVVSSNYCSGTVGGVYLTGGTVRNCLIAGNHCAAGGPVGVRLNGAGSLFNCTIAGNSNTVDTVVFAAMSIEGKGGTVQNCIVWGNEDVTNQVVNTSVNSTVDHNAWTEDPKFKNAVRGDYRLISSSPCIDAGDDDVWPDLDTALDLNQHPRKQGKHVDIGCYEGARRGLVIFFH